MTTILVVDDHADALETTAILFEDKGYHVLRATNAAEAMDVVNKTPIDILFTDFVMPGKLRSIDLANATKRLYPSAIIIFATGYDKSIIDKDAVGDAKQVLKPVMIDDVHTMIQSMITGQDQIY